MKNITDRLIKQKYVYHYTSFDTLFAILDGCRKSKDKNFFSLRASNVYKLNDPSEMLGGYEVVKNLLCHYEEDNGIPKELRLSEVFNNNDYEEECKQDYLNGREGDVIESGIIPYVSSLSLRGDYLPMWSLYGVKGKGVCLVFDLKELLELDGFMKGLVYYEGTTNSFGVKEALSFMYNLYLRDYSEKTICIREKIRELATICLSIASFVKHKDYQYEKEFRIVCNQQYIHPIDSRLFAKSLFKIKPFIDINIPIRVIKGIIIGPAANYEVMSHVLILLLKECGLSHRIITQSAISFKDTH